jgi:hypothetical protein
MTIVEILERYGVEEVLKADGFDNAVIGIEDSSGRLVYSVSKCIDILVCDEGLTEEEALEHFWFNVAGSYVGELTPIWCNDL